MNEYHQLLSDILSNGDIRQDRTGTGTISMFGYQMRFDLRYEFPAVTTKKLAWKSVVGELLWFLEGSTDERRLCEIMHGTRDPSKTTIWTANADVQGKALGYTNNDQVKELGPVYGSQWRDFDSVDQIDKLVNDLQNNPYSRRHILTAWNVGELDKMALPPCHLLAQFYVTNNDELSCQLYQRSADAFLGVPFNIASYALLTHILAKVTGLKVGELVHTIGDAHIYRDHVDQVITQLTRDHRSGTQLKMPEFNRIEDVLALSVNDFELVGYNPHPAIQGNMSV